MPQGKMSPGKVPPGKLPPRKIAPRKITPPPLPLKKYFVKFLYVMEYLSGENFVNEEFRRLLQQTVILSYSSFEEFVDSLIHCNIWKRPP